MYQVLARKWRPRNFKELVGQQHVTQALTYALEHQQVHHAYLFTGTRGVGKTTIARIFAKSLNCLTNGISSEPCGVCEHCREIDEGRFPDLIEVDAASRSQVDYTRQLLANVPYSPAKGRFKVYLIDEVHMFSDESFNALLKTLEEPPEHVKFILATTDPQKVPITVLSRCLQFQLKNMTAKQISDHLKIVLANENVAFDNEAVELIAEAAQGSMRDSLSLLDQAIAYGQGAIRTTDVASLLGAVPAIKIQEIFACLADGDGCALRVKLAELSEFSPDYVDLLKRILQGLQKITIVQLGAQRHPDEVSAELAAIAMRLPIELVQLWYQIATDGWQSLPYQPDLATALEMTLLRMLALQPVFPEADLQKIRPIASPQPHIDEVNTIQEVIEEQELSKESMPSELEQTIDDIAGQKLEMASVSDMQQKAEQTNITSTVDVPIANSSQRDEVPPPWELDSIPEHIEKEVPQSQLQASQIEAPIKEEEHPTQSPIVEENVIALENLALEPQIGASSQLETDTDSEVDQQVQAFLSQPIVKTLVDQFGASVDINSIRPLKTKE